MKESVFVDELSYTYDKKNNVLKKISFNIKQGERVGLIGANGAGKSTLLKLMVGLIDDYEGELRIRGKAVNKKNLKDIREELAYVFPDSDSQLFLTTVYEDVAFGPRNYGYDKDEVDKRVLEALRRVHIEALKDRTEFTLSGGQKKLASIATILSMSPEIVLLDEPSITLDPRNRRNLIKVINNMDITKIIASHDLDLIKQTCDRVIFLNEGKIIYDGDTMKIIDDQGFLEENGL